jgi:serine/threonine-protein kinase RsbT
VGQPAREIPVGSRAGIEEARRAARAMAISLGFSTADIEAIVLATIELATNLHRYARMGVIQLSPRNQAARAGIEIASRDSGPGIADLDAAIRDGYSTGGGFGDGLPSVRRLMDEFSIASDPAGTTITACKWRATI